MPSFFSGNNRVGLDPRRNDISKPEIQPRSQILMKEIEMPEKETSSFIIRVETASPLSDTCSSSSSTIQQKTEIEIISKAKSSSTTD